MPDPTTRLTWPEGLTLDLDDLIFPDLEGNIRALGDPELAGKLIIVDILATWCANCHEASAYVSGLYDRYKDRGLSVVGLAFELGGQPAAIASRLGSYKTRYGLDYPILIATDSAEQMPTEVFAEIEGEFAFPTFIFVRGDGRVLRVHAGFTGPAAGEAFEELKRGFEGLIEEALGTATARRQPERDQR